MPPPPITPNIKLEVELLPMVYQQLQSINAGNHFSINYLINKACMRDLGIPDAPLDDETAWGTTSRSAGAEE